MKLDSFVIGKKSSFQLLSLVYGTFLNLLGYFSLYECLQTFFTHTYCTYIEITK